MFDGSVCGGGKQKINTSKERVELLDTTSLPKILASRRKYLEQRLRSNIREKQKVKCFTARKCKPPGRFSLFWEIFIVFFFFFSYSVGCGLFRYNVQRDGKTLMCSVGRGARTSG